MHFKSIACQNQCLFPVKEAQTRAAVPVAATPPPGEKSDWSTADQSVAELRDWLTLLERMLRSQRVAVGDCEEIEQVLNKQKVQIIEFYLIRINNVGQNPIFFFQTCKILETLHSFMFIGVFLLTN